MTYYREFGGQGVGLSDKIMFEIRPEGHEGAATKIQDKRPKQKVDKCPLGKT